MRCHRRVGPQGLARLFRSFGAAALVPTFLLGCAAPAADASVAPRASGDGSAAAVVSSLSEGGVSCAPVSQRTLATYVADAVSCPIDGKDVIIRTFADAGDRDRFLEASDSLVAQMSAAVDPVPLIIGPTWIITTDDEATAASVQAVLGGEIR